MMSPDLGWIIFLYSFSLFITLYLFLYTALRFRIYPGAGQFALIVLLETLWIFGNICELLSPTLQQKLFWDNLQWPPCLLTGIAVLWFTMAYTNVIPRRARRLLIISILGWMAVEIIQIVTIYGHGIRPGARLETRGDFISLTYPFLPADNLVMAYQYLLILASIIHLIGWGLRQPKLYRTHALMVLGGLLFPVVGTIGELAGFSIGPQRDFSPMLFAAGNSIVAWGLFRLGLFNMIYAAREKAVENIRDPLIVLDAYDRFTDVNKAARDIFNFRLKDVYGKYAPDLLPQAIQLSCYSPRNEIQEEIHLEPAVRPSNHHQSADTMGAELRSYELSVLPVTDRLDQLQGRVLMMHDITLRKHNEEIQRKVNEERLLRQSYEATIAGWSKALELRDKETLGHSERVTELSMALASRFGLQREDLQNFKHGVLLHDIGKMGIPDTILLKNGPLDEKEWAIMRQHPQYAEALLAKIEYLRPALLVAYYHHERWNGSGYPLGLKGEDIPLWARLFAVVDVWDALTSDRPYRHAWSEDAARSYLKNNAGILFDSRVVNVFLEMV